ncbi:3-keto-5-aminohexanoate cleavage protein [uncultured Roseovarius sp.]|uniref:3-keto-5-aminohexanoate cleavage protein n=1 Tax=uncultured Roseovarius sp. TaxID=293344 RepID=UPI00260A19CE|nr:3-keto-5-aminohexanoate cleavage protein [uncultured Roseovarius sp.]
MTALPALMVAPNGARRTKADHPALPMTLPEIVATARACAAEGADGLHLHLRDAQGRHVLDAGLYAEALAELRSAVPGMALQVTTEAVGLYASEHQRHVALHSGAGLVSIAPREIVTDTAQNIVMRFYQDCAERGIAVQHILYEAGDLELLRNVLPPTLFTAPDLQLIFVLGRYTAGQQSDPTDLEAFLKALTRENIAPDWALCAFGVAETACLCRAHHLGGKMRVGFENSLWHADGRVARDNADRVRALRFACAAPSDSNTPAP